MNIQEVGILSQIVGAHLLWQNEHNQDTCPSSSTNQGIDTPNHPAKTSEVPNSTMKMINEEWMNQMNPCFKDVNDFFFFETVTQFLLQ